jgi:hypothetical protein
MRTVPVKYSAGPLAEGCEPFRLMSICKSPMFDWSGAPSCDGSQDSTAQHQLFDAGKMAATVF